ncbi:MAG: 23S rRNA (uracil(1939)-C(5))-methyltransferase RlmD [Tyzzerella sp.]|nr:23S rRNA (uracil(1939)-C(5))-methyltransferase RlmD [Tyzzerella sp.]
MKKNEKIVVTIEDIGVSGEGIGKVDGYTLFVKDAVIGDTVEAVITKAKKNYGYAKMLRILEASNYRVEKKCPVARQCGGCQIQELSYEAQLDFKAKKVYGNLERIGGFAPEFLDTVMEPICGMEEPFYYRNKAQFPIGTDKQGNIVTGFYAGRTHSIISNTECALGVSVNQEILHIVLDFMNQHGISAYDETMQRGLVRHVLIRYGFKTGEIMVCLVINGDKIPKSEKLVDKLTQIQGMTSITYSVNKENTNVIMGKEIGILWGQGYITDYIGDVKYQISPLSFFQVNPVQTEKLYGLALEYADLKGEETVWDLYCGIGTISLFLAQKAKKVYGVEIIPQAIDDARNNAKINGIENAEFFVGKAEEVLPEQYEVNHVYADVIVVDPPRKGCDETLLRTMVHMKPERIVYVSCDSATLARDLKYLCEHGYELKKVKPVDQFPHTVHVETVIMLQKEN